SLSPPNFSSFSITTSVLSSDPAKICWSPSPFCHIPKAPQLQPVETPSVAVELSFCVVVSSALFRWRQRLCLTPLNRRRRSVVAHSNQTTPSPLLQVKFRYKKEIKISSYVV
ncbi:hypothetical protein PIB30_071089, partial [Stylosanthes scabra]|nr:hypothetical protein [Stylosanthes scabra]